MARVAGSLAPLTGRSAVLPRLRPATLHGAGGRHADVAGALREVGSGPVLGGALAFGVMVQGEPLAVHGSAVGHGGRSRFDGLTAPGAALLVLHAPHARPQREGGEELARSEERRVGKEWRCRWSPEH